MDLPPPSSSSADRALPAVHYLTAGIPGVGGKLKARPEDFLVEEIPAYEPCGDGEHIYLFVEKRNHSTMHVVRLLAEHFGVRRDAVGVAGLKDKFAVTRQLFSVHTPGKKPADFPAFERDGITIHWIDRHTNKLRRGHLAGNRFIIRVRDVEPVKVVHAHRALAMLAKFGVPNRIGEQRFGHMGNNHTIGRALLLHDAQALLDILLGPSAIRPEAQPEGRALYAQGRFAEALHAFPPSLHTERRVLAALARGEKPKRAMFTIERLEQSFYLTAFQSAVFNEVLHHRLREGTFATLLDGDLAFKHDSGAVFPIGPAELADADIAQRLADIQVSPSGPMWGARMTRAAAEVGQFETAALERAGVTIADLDTHAAKARDPLPGERRPLRVPITHVDVEGGMDEHGAYIKCVFELPRGSFATTVMQEVMKTAPHAEESEDE
jgi:tRNA pseudouridine13 synthase